jgi:ubiquinone/menaquinone biosynthesis C-methylase UbiE
MNKTQTDLFWNERPQIHNDSRKVNIDDLAQREIENDFLLKHLKPTDEVLEVGCGNGFLTSLLRQHVKHVDAFDYSENMVSQAKELYGQTNNAFFHDNVINPQHVEKTYDVVVCIRVLINLADFEQQKQALKNLLSWVKPGGKLLLLEGFKEGFEALNKVRIDANMKELSPASINYYSPLKDFEQLFPETVSIVDTMHTGTFDFLTRIVYPALVGPDTATGPADFHDKILGVAKAYNPDHMKNFARLVGWAISKR